MRKLKCNDEVIVITGRDKGKRGTISRLIGSEKVIVHGVNMLSVIRSQIRMRVSPAV